MYIKDRLDNVTPGTRRSFYKRLIKVAKTNEELDDIRLNLIKDSINITVPYDVDGIYKLIDKRNLLLEDEIGYKNLLDDIDKANSFEECMNLKQIALEKGIGINENIYGAILYKARDREQINLIMEEIENQNIILKSLGPREYSNFSKIETFEKMLDAIKRYYFNGKLVDIKIYMIALNNIENIQHVKYIKNQVKFRFTNYNIEIKNNKDMMKLMLINDDLNEILKYKKKLEDDGKRLNRKCYNEILYKCRTYEDAEGLFKEKLQNGYDVEYSNYLNLIGLSKDFAHAKQLKNEMESYGIECDIKIYQKLINKCNSGKEVIKILIEMVELNIPIDDKLIEVAITKADNLEQVSQMKAFYQCLKKKDILVKIK